jgi:hypothetical protein
MMPEAVVKITQYCSVCREELAMAVVPTGDGEDDGVIWLQCPRCHGFLPKIGSTLEEIGGDGEQTDVAGREPETAAAEQDAAAETVDAAAEAETLEEATPAATTPVGEATDVTPSPLTTSDSPDELETHAADAVRTDAEISTEVTEEPAVEPDNDLAAYAALLAEQDVTQAVPYRPWDHYEVGDVIHHLAWDDCGIVVAKESLPGNRKVVKAYFEKAGVVRLIEEAPREP